MLVATSLSGILQCMRMKKLKYTFLLKLQSIYVFSATFMQSLLEPCKNDINATYAYIVELIKPKGDETCLPVSLY